MQNNELKLKIFFAIVSFFFNQMKYIANISSEDGKNNLWQRHKQILTFIIKKTLSDKHVFTIFFFFFLTCWETSNRSIRNLFTEFPF